MPFSTAKACRPPRCPPSPCEQKSYVKTAYFRELDMPPISSDYIRLQRLQRLPSKLCLTRSCEIHELPKTDLNSFLQMTGHRPIDCEASKSLQQFPLRCWKMPEDAGRGKPLHPTSPARSCPKRAVAKVGTWPRIVSACSASLAVLW